MLNADYCLLVSAFGAWNLGFRKGEDKPRHYINWDFALLCHYFGKSL